jgi:uncharacterized damage-inducible protein DinB
VRQVQQGGLGEASGGYLNVAHADSFDHAANSGRREISSQTLTCDKTFHMNYDFLISAYQTECLKVLSVWSMFRDEDMNTRPHPEDRRGRNVREQMIHQCLSEDLWFRRFFGMDVETQELPKEETRLAFIQKYSADSEHRARILATQKADWWEQEVDFFKTARIRAWVMVRRIAHTAHHRGQQTALLRMLNREIYSTYGPTADTGGLPKHGALTIYPYADVESLIARESTGGAKTPLPELPNEPLTERGTGTE